MIAKLRVTPGIYLAGFMGSGKSTVGRLLADELGWDFVDLDKEVEAAAGSAISDIFEHAGEPAFRLIERKALREQVQLVREGNARVVAIGGGAFCEPRNRERIEDSGVSIWLDVPWEKIWRRICQETNRPLARDRQRCEELFRKRQEHYAKADYRIPADLESPHEVVRAILDLGLV